MTSERFALFRAFERLALGRAFAILLSACVTAPIANAQPSPTNPPMPPPRPAFPSDAPRTDSPADSRGDSNDVRLNDLGSQVTPKSGEAPVAPPASKPPADWTWPPADRQAMRACALEWQRLKETGASGVTTWRDFAPGCLKRQTAPRK